MEKGPQAMRTRRILTTAAGVVVFSALVVGGATLARNWIAGDGPDFPDPPFPKVDDDYPRVIRVADFDQMTRPEFQAQDVTLLPDGALRRASADEREAVRLVHRSQRKYVKGRELAVKILKSHPDSVSAQFARAVAVFKGEGNLPGALHQIRQLRKQLEQRGRANPQDKDALEWYLRVMDEEYRILRDLDRPEEQLRLVATL